MSLSQQISGGYGGQGLGLLITKLAWEGKVKDRDEIAMEIVRRGEAGETQPAAGSGDGKP